VEQTIEAVVTGNCKKILVLVFLDTQQEKRKEQPYFLIPVNPFCDMAAIPEFCNIFSENSPSTSNHK